MKRLIVMAVALSAWVPLAASAQAGADEEEDEFYRDVDVAQSSAEERGGDADIGLTAEAGAAGSPSRFRNSLFIYENAFSARPASTDLSAASTFYYAMSYDFQPRFYIMDWLHLRGRFVLEQELANSDSTTYLYEPVASDTTLDVRFTNLLAPVTDWVNLGALARLTIPTSKVSLARTLVLGTTAGLTLDRTFPLLEGLTLTYGFEFTKYWNRYTTSVLDEPLIEPGVGARPGPGDVGLYALGSERYENGALRNPSMLFRNSFGLDLSPIENLTLSVSVLWYSYLLYPVTDVDATDLATMVVCANPGACPVATSDENTDLRVSLWYVVELSYDVLPWLGLAIGTSTLNPQLTPDSSYRAPFFNRYTNFYFDVSINADELARFIIGRTSRRGS